MSDQRKKHDEPSRFEWTCHHCGEWIADPAAGYVWSDFAYGEWWVVTHFDCDPLKGHTGYWYGLERLGSWQQIAELVSHVGRKRWCTDGATSLNVAVRASLMGEEMPQRYTNRYLAHLDGEFPA